MLRSMVDQVEGVMCFGEIFRKAHSKSNRFQKIERVFGDRERARLSHKGSAFDFWQELVANAPDTHDYVGAKIFYRHRKGDAIWDYIASGKLAIIHLYRNELFEAFVSRQRARNTGVWRASQKDSSSQTSEAQKKLEFDPKEYESYRDSVHTAFARWDSLIGDNPNVLTVDYTTLCDLSRANELLGTFFQREVSLQPRTEKQARHPAIDSIANPALALPYIEDRLRP